MREPDIPFRQFDFIKDSAYLQVTNPEGVCKVLVAEWLAGGGALGGSTFRRRGRGFNTSTRVGMAMETQRSTTLTDYGLQIVGQSETLSLADAAWTRYVGQIGFAYYVKIQGPEDGHAIGVLNKDKKIRIFDPNFGEWHCTGVADMTSTMLDIALHYVSKYGFNEIECMQLQMPSFLGHS